jgi:hypothetical protein
MARRAPAARVSAVRHGPAECARKFPALLLAALLSLFLTFPTPAAARPSTPSLLRAFNRWFASRGGRWSPGVHAVADEPECPREVRASASAAAAAAATSDGGLRGSGGVGSGAAATAGGAWGWGEVAAPDRADVRVVTTGKVPRETVRERRESEKRGGRAGSEGCLDAFRSPRLRSPRRYRAFVPRP